MRPNQVAADTWLAHENDIIIITNRSHNQYLKEEKNWCKTIIVHQRSVDVEQKKNKRDRYTGNDGYSFIF